MKNTETHEARPPFGVESAPNLYTITASWGEKVRLFSFTDWDEAHAIATAEEMVRLNRAYKGWRKSDCEAWHGTVTMTSGGSSWVIARPRTPRED